MIKISNIMRLQANVDSAFRELHKDEVDSWEHVAFVTARLEHATDEVLSFLQWSPDLGFDLGADTPIGKLPAETRPGGWPADPLPEQRKNLYNHWAANAASLAVELGEAAGLMFDCVSKYASKKNLPDVTFTNSLLTSCIMDAGTRLTLCLAAITHGDFSSSGVNMKDYADQLYKILEKSRFVMFLK